MTRNGRRLGGRGAISHSTHRGQCLPCQDQEAGWEGGTQGQRVPVAARGKMKHSAFLMETGARYFPQFDPLFFLTHVRIGREPN